MSDARVPVLPLRDAPGERSSWDRSKGTVYLWAVAELLFVTNPWQISSSIRAAVLRWFGAEIGTGVIMRPRIRVRFPWKLHIGNDCWIGEGVWFHNQDHVRIGNDVVISQETFLTTGSHAHRVDMALITRPIEIGAGSWITARCMVLGGTKLGKSCLVKPMSVISGTQPANSLLEGNPARVTGLRFAGR